MVHLKNQNWGPPGGVCVGCVALGFQSVKCLGSTKDHRLVLGRIIPSVSRAVCGKHQDFFFLSWNFCLYFPSWKILSETVDGLFQRIPRDSYLQGPWEHKSIGVVIAGSSWRMFPSTHPLGSLHCLVLPRCFREPHLPCLWLASVASLKREDHKGGRGLSLPLPSSTRRLSILIFNHSGALSSRFSNFPSSFHVLNRIPFPSLHTFIYSLKSHKNSV